MKCLDSTGRDVEPDPEKVSRYYFWLSSVKTFWNFSIFGLVCKYRLSSTIQLLFNKSLVMWGPRGSEWVQQALLRFHRGVIEGPKVSPKQAIKVSSLSYCAQQMLQTNTLLLTIVYHEKGEFKYCEISQGGRRVFEMIIFDNKGGRWLQMITWAHILSQPKFNQQLSSTEFEV